MKFRMFNGCDRGLCRCAVGRQDRQLNTYDWLADVPGNAESTDLVEVQFKNTRKGYYHNVNNLDLKKGDVVAVEANPGHDIGVVTLTGRLVKLQIKKANLRSADDIKRIYRIAKPVDFEKWDEAKSREHGTMIQSRQIAKDLGLKMKIGDVEYQGDGNKAIFYYIADERVDFRQLIKVLADTFHVRIEMKQIGARQEAGRIGGTGPCGRELCCATWMKNFVSVGTNAARFQDISLNPQKLAGMCAKLKCCLNYEVDNYVEASKKLPPKDDLSRFDKAKKKKKNNNRQNNRKRNAQGDNRQQADNRAENKQQGENRQDENRQQGDNRPNRQQNNRRRNNNRPRPQQGENNKGEANKAETNKAVTNKGEGNKGEANKGNGNKSGENKAPNNE